MADEEYALMYFKSFCIIVAKAPYTIAIVASRMIMGEYSLAASGIRNTATLEDNHNRPVSSKSRPGTSTPPSVRGMPVRYPGMEGEQRCENAKTNK